MIKILKRCLLVQAIMWFPLLFVSEIILRAVTGTLYKEVKTDE